MIRIDEELKQQAELELLIILVIWIFVMSVASSAIRSFGYYDFATDETFFRDLNPKADSWHVWNTIFQKFDNKQLDDDAQKTWTQVTGLPYTDNPVPRNALFLLGRRSGKTVKTTQLVLKRAIEPEQGKLVGGERAYHVVVSPTIQNSEVMMRHFLHYFKTVPLLRREVTKETKDEIHLRNNSVIAVRAAGVASGLGLSVRTLVMEEADRYRVDAIITAKEVYRNFRYAMLTFPDSAVYILTTPYTREGLVYDFYQKYHAKPNDYMLVVQAPTYLMNPPLKDEAEAEKERDPYGYMRDIEATWTDEQSSAFDYDAAMAVINNGVRELPFVFGLKHFAGFDASGLKGRDETVLTIFRREKDLVVQCCIRAFRKGSPTDVMNEILHTLRTHQTNTVTGDNVGFGWLQEHFQKAGVRYQLSEISKSQAFMEMVPMVNQKSILLLDDPIQTKQLIQLERRKTRTGRDEFGHPKGNYTDDRINAAALAINAARYVRTSPGIYC